MSRWQSRRSYWAHSVSLNILIVNKTLGQQYACTMTQDHVDLQHSAASSAAFFSNPFPARRAAAMIDSRCWLSRSFCGSATFARSALSSIPIGLPFTCYAADDLRKHMLMIYLILQFCRCFARLRVCRDFVAISVDAVIIDGLNHQTIVT